MATAMVAENSRRVPMFGASSEAAFDRDADSIAATMAHWSKDTAMFSDQVAETLNTFSPIGLALGEQFASKFDSLPIALGASLSMWADAPNMFSDSIADLIDSWTIGLAGGEQFSTSRFDSLPIALGASLSMWADAPNMFNDNIASALMDSWPTGLALGEQFASKFDSLTSIGELLQSESFAGLGSAAHFAGMLQEVTDSFSGIDLNIPEISSIFKGLDVDLMSRIATLPADQQMTLVDLDAPEIDELATSLASNPVKLKRAMDALLFVALVVFNSTPADVLDLVNNVENAIDAVPGLKLIGLILMVHSGFKMVVEPKLAPGPVQDERDAD